MALARPTPVGASHELYVPDMDCADCARKVEAALSRVEGVSEVSVSFATRRLRLRLDESLVSLADVERRLAYLGYPPRGQAGPTAGAASAAQPSTDAGRDEQAPDPWHRTSKGRYVIATGALLALSALLSLAFPPLGRWGFAAATLLGVAPLARKAWTSARLGEPFTISTLVSLAALGAVGIGEAAEGAVVVFLFAVGELLEGVAAGRARAGIRALAALAPKTALLLDGAGTREVPVEALRPGDLVRVLPGSRVPADGTVVAGTAGVDESPVTGESVPAAKGPGDRVFAGSIATDAALSVRVDAPAGESTVARIAHLVAEAEASKAPVARFIDRFSRVYTPAAMLVAALVAVAPPLLLGAAWESWVYRALALLLIACPCALVLSVPAAVTSGISAGARRGLLVKGGAVLEAIGGVRTVAFDKTGTLTEGRPRVTDVVALAGTEDEVLRLAAAVETGSSHPLAKAIVERAAGLDVPPAQDARSVAGRAVTAEVEGRRCAVASPRHAAELAPLPGAVEERIAALEREGKTVVVLLQDAAPLGLIALRDEPRPDAAAAVSRLARLGVRSVMLTGDNARTGEAVALQLGLEARSELLPEGKLAAVEELRRRGRVAMVGDGINDAPAMARADVAVAMGGATDLALETAGAVVLRGEATGVSDLVELSRATMRNVRQNVAFALGLKAVFLVTTLLGVTGLWPAVLSDTGATVLVTANALRLLRFEPGRRPRGA